MFDFFKIKDLAIGMNIMRILPFPLSIEEGSGEILKKKRSTKLRNLVFTITPGNNPKAKLQGSIHKYANKGLHNYDRFTRTRFMEVMEDLSTYISANDQINLIEFAVNLHTPFPPPEFIRSLRAHKKRRINITDRLGIHYAEVKHSQYQLKIYDKGLQYGQKNILRIEIRIEKMENLFPNGLKWKDLNNKVTWEYMGSRLIKSFNEVIYYDPNIDLSLIPSEREKSILQEGNNPIYWEDLQVSHPERKRAHFQRLVRKYGSTFGNISNLIQEELNTLIEIQEPRNVAFSDHFSEQKNVTSFSGSYKNVAFSDTLLSGQFSPPVINYPTVTDTDPVPEQNDTSRRLCQVTGINIANQKSGSKFLCYAGLRWLLKTDPLRFKDIRDQRLSAKWDFASLDIQIREIAHSIRNEYFNPIHNTKRAIYNILKDPVLFDQLPFIRQDRKKLAGISF